MFGERKSLYEYWQTEFQHSPRQESVYENLDESSEKLNNRDGGHEDLTQSHRSDTKRFVSPAVFPFNASRHQTSMSQRVCAPRAGEEDIDGILAITEPRGRPDETLVGRMREDFAFRGKAIGVGLYHRHGDPFVRIKTFDLFDRDDRRPMTEKAHFRPPKRAGLGAC